MDTFLSLELYSMRRCSMKKKGRKYRQELKEGIVKLIAEQGY
jgi:hypothetical protein